MNSSAVKNGEFAAEVLLRMNNFVGKVGEELKVTWHWLLVGFLISMVVSVVYIVLARWITLPLVIISALGSLVVIGLVTS